MRSQGSFAILFIFVFLNIALAVIYQRYTQDRENEIVEQNAKRHISLALAYQTIDCDSSKTIDKREFMDFMTTFRTIRLSELAAAKKAAVVKSELDLIWTSLEPKAMPTDGSELAGPREEIGPTEFIKLPQIIAAKTYSAPPAWATEGLGWGMKRVQTEHIHLVDRDPESGLKHFRQPPDGHVFARQQEVVVRAAETEQTHTCTLCARRVFMRCMSASLGDPMVRDIWGKAGALPPAEG